MRNSRTTPLNSGDNTHLKTHDMWQTSLRPQLDAPKLATVTTTSSASSRLGLQIPIGPFPDDILPRKNGKALLQAHFKLIGKAARRQGYASAKATASPALWDIKQNHLANADEPLRQGILAGYSAGSTGEGYSAECSAGSTRELLRDTRRDALAGCSGTGEPLWRDTRRDPLARLSGILAGLRWRAALGCFAGSTRWQDT